MSVTAERKKSNRARLRGRSKLTTIEMPTAIHRALGACALAERRTRTAIILMALEAYLGEAGFWPEVKE